MSQSTTEHKVVRPLGRLETMQSALHVTRQMCGTIVTCRYTLPPHLFDEISAVTLKDALRDGIARAILDHPLLQVGQINENSSEPAWIQLDTIDLNYHINWEVVKSDEDYGACFEMSILRNLDTWFPDLGTRPGWRISVIIREGIFDNVDLMFAWNHANMDGMGGKIFHQTLLHNLNTHDPEKPLVYLKPGLLELPDASKRFSPRPEDLVKYPLSTKFVSKTVWDDVKSRIHIGKNNSHAFWCPIREQPFDSAFRSITIDARTLKTLLARGREMNTTLTGLFHGLLMTSLALQLRKEAKSMTSITALDHRRFMPTSPESHTWYNPHNDIANNVSILFHDYPAELLQAIRTKVSGNPAQIEVIEILEDLVWSAAVQTRHEIEDRLNAGLQDDLMGLCKFVNDWRSQMRSMTKRPRTASWCVTNLGVIDGSGVGNKGWKVSKSWFDLSTEVTAAAVHVGVVSIKGGELVIHVGWQKCTLNATIGERVASDLKIWLDFLGKNKVIEQVG